MYKCVVDIFDTSVQISPLYSLNSVETKGESSSRINTKESVVRVSKFRQLLALWPVNES